MRRKLNKKKIFLYLVVPFGIIIGIIIGQKVLKPKKEIQPKSKYYSECDHVHNANAPIEPKDKLNDPNVQHLIHAQKNGLKQPFKTNKEFSSKIAGLVQKSILIPVTENRFYQLKSLTHSQPYLIPEAIDMLDEIGYRFQKRLNEKKQKSFRFRITSLLRTEETQNNLSHRNGNATGHSAHLYGTTVDISYKNFYNIKADSIESNFEAVQALTKVLIEMRQECKLLAVTERHQSCFHITVVLCKPMPQTVSPKQ